MEDEQAYEGRGRPNLSRETNSQELERDRKNIISPAQLTHEPDWQPYQVDLCSTEIHDQNDDKLYIQL